MCILYKKVKIVLFSYDPMVQVLCVIYLFLQNDVIAVRKEGLGVVLDSQLPHLIGIDDDICSTGIMLYHIKVRLLVSLCYVFLLQIHIFFETSKLSFVKNYNHLLYSHKKGVYRNQPVCVSVCLSVVLFICPIILYVHLLLNCSILKLK